MRNRNLSGSEASLNRQAPIFGQRNVYVDHADAETPLLSGTRWYKVQLSVGTEGLIASSSWFERISKWYDLGFQ